MLRKLFAWLTDTSTHIVPSTTIGDDPYENDIGKVRGHKRAKTALMIAAYGRFNVLLVGPPGEGKSLLVKSLSSFLPWLDEDQRAETDSIYRYGGLSWGREDPPIVTVGPSITKSSLLGGGQRPLPGAISLAHNGILYVDELNELPRQLVESLRIPLEEKTITHSRGGISRTFRCDFQLIAACNPCQCGYAGYDRCTCSNAELSRYDKKLSGPILDRIDMVIHLDMLGEDTFDPPIKGQSDLFHKKITDAIEFRESQGRYSPSLPGDLFLSHSDSDVRWSHEGFTYFQSLALSPNSTLSTRRLTRLGRIARAIADLTLSEEIKAGHVESARAYLGKY